MTEFVVNVWHEFTSDDAFERTIPLALNGRRMARLGLRNPVNLVFLLGLDRLSPRYQDELRALGYRLHDASALVEDLAPMLRVFAERWKGWGGIKHYCMARFPVMRRVFPGTPLITFDGDMVVNAPFAEMEAALAGRLYLLGGSSCFAAIPATSDFFAVLEDQMAAISRDPDAYARDVAGLASADEFFNPHILRGSDQGIIALLFRRGLLRQQTNRQKLAAQGLAAFPNLLQLHKAGDTPLAYRREDGTDFLGAHKVMIWHMSAGVCGHLGRHVFLRDWLGEDTARRFGRVPLQQPAADLPEETRTLGGLLTQARQLGRRFPFLGSQDPFSRARVCQSFFEESDFGFALNEDCWHESGVFA